MDTVGMSEYHAYLADTINGFSNALITIFDYPSSRARTSILENARKNFPNLNYAKYAYESVVFEVNPAGWKYRRVYGADYDSAGTLLAESLTGEEWREAKDGSLAELVLNYYLDHERRSTLTTSGWDTIGMSATTIYVTRANQKFETSTVVIRNIPRANVRDSVIRSVSSQIPGTDFSRYAFTDVAYAVNCLDYSYRIVMGSECEQSGKAIRTVEFDDGWQHPEYGTIADVIVRYVCRRLN